MLKSTASILESFSSVAVLLILLLMMLIALAACCFGSLMAMDFMEMLPTPIPY